MNKKDWAKFGYFFFRCCILGSSIKFNHVTVLTTIAQTMPFSPKDKNSTMHIVDKCNHVVEFS